MHALDTAELFFDELRVPVQNLLGREGEGFECLMQQLPWERLLAAVYCIAAAESALAMTINYAHARKLFDRKLLAFQNTRFVLAELKTEVQIGRTFVDHCIQLSLQQKLDAATASMAKYWASNLQFKVMDKCVQLHGGYGYMLEYPIARAWGDSGVFRLAGGCNEIMMELISRTL